MIYLDISFSFNRCTFKINLEKPKHKGNKDIYTSNLRSVTSV